MLFVLFFEFLLRRIESSVPSTIGVLGINCSCWLCVSFYKNPKSRLAYTLAQCFHRPFPSIRYSSQRDAMPHSNLICKLHSSETGRLSISLSVVFCDHEIIPSKRAENQFKTLWESSGPLFVKICHKASKLRSQFLRQLQEL